MNLSELGAQVHREPVFVKNNPNSGPCMWVSPCPLPLFYGYCAVPITRQGPMWGSLIAPLFLNPHGEATPPWKSYFSLGFWSSAPDLPSPARSLWLWKLVIRGPGWSMSGWAGTPAAPMGTWGQTSTAFSTLDSGPQHGCRPGEVLTLPTESFGVRPSLGVM